MELNWSIYPQSIFESPSCELDYKVAFVNIPIDLIFNTESFSLRVDVNDLNSSSSIDGKGKTHFKCRVKPVYINVQKTDDDGDPIPNEYERILATDWNYYCTLNAGSFDNTTVYQDDFGVWLEGDIQPLSAGGYASITVTRLLLYDYVNICYVSTYYYRLAHGTPDDWSHNDDWDDVKVSFTLTPNLTIDNIVSGEQPEVKTNTVILGDNDPNRVGLSYTWSLIPNVATDTGTIDLEHIKQLIENSSPIRFKTIDVPINFVDYFPNTIGYYRYDDTQLDENGNPVWRPPSADKYEFETMQVYVAFISDLQLILSLIYLYKSGELFRETYDPLDEPIEDPYFSSSYITFICVDNKSYQSYLSGESNTFTAFIVHIISQHNIFKVRPVDISDDNASGEVLTIEGCKSDNGYAWINLGRSYDDNETLIYVNGAFTQSQFQLKLDAIYGTAITVDTPKFLVEGLMPNCIAMYKSWTDNDNNDNNDDGSNDDNPLPPIPPNPDYNTYTCEVVGKDSYSWYCDENATFDVIVKRIDNIKLSPSNYTFTVNCNDIEYTIDQANSKITFNLPQEDKYISFDVNVTINDNGQTTTGFGSFSVSKWGDRILTAEITTDKLYYDYGITDPMNITVNITDINGNTISGLTLTDNWNNTYSDNGDGRYTTSMNVSNLPIGQYQIFIKIDTNDQCYKNNLADQIVTETFIYNPIDFENQDFKLTYPLIENLKVYVNDTEITEYTTTLNQYGELILHIDSTLNENDTIKVEYQSYTTSTVFFIGNSEPVSCTQVDEVSISKFGRAPPIKIYIPFLSSQEEACEIAQQYLKYYAWPSKIIVTDNKW